MKKILLPFLLLTGFAGLAQEYNELPIPSKKQLALA